MTKPVLHLSQLLQMLNNLNNEVDVNDYSDLIVSTFYSARRDVKASTLRGYLLSFVQVGFNPFSPHLSDVSKIQMKSIIAKCDSCI